MSRSIVMAISSIVFVLGVSACNTVEGAGEDVESVGEEIEEAAD